MLVSAWQLFRRVSELYARSFPEEDADRRPINFQANERSFYKLVGEILQGRGDGSAEELARYQWSGGCGTGAESLTRPQSLAMFIALLNEKRIPEAVGAALRFESGVPILSADGRVARLEFFEACGLDWETLLVGAQAATFADVPFYGWSWKREKPPRNWPTHGSERAAELVLELAQHADKESHSRYAGALTGFLPPRPAGEDGSYRVSSDEISRRNELALSPATRARIVAALEKIAVPKHATRWWRLRWPAWAGRCRAAAAVWSASTWTARLAGLSDAPREADEPHGAAEPRRWREAVRRCARGMRFLRMIVAPRQARHPSSAARYSRRQGFQLLGGRLPQAHIRVLPRAIGEKRDASPGVFRPG